LVTPITIPGRIRQKPQRGRGSGLPSLDSKLSGLGTNAGIILELGDRRFVRNGLIRNDRTDEKGVAMWLVVIYMRTSSAH
jgi:hypothetical protein